MTRQYIITRLSVNDSDGEMNSYLEAICDTEEAARELLQDAFNDVFFNDGFTITWHRKDGTVGYFCIPGYENIQKAIEQLQHGRYKEFLDTFSSVDQAIKAIMNDPELDHADCGSFKFSELVSVLCECHFIPEPNFQQEP